MSRDDMFSRWADRRARVAREEAEARAEVTTPEVPPDLPEPATPEEEDALLAQLGLPRPEDVAGAEIRRFFARGVPEMIRRRALRALWRSDPTFAVLDGLNDYDEDFTLPEFNQKVVATAYQVGRGIVREIEKVVAPDPDEIGDEDDDETAEPPLISVRPPEDEPAAIEAADPATPETVADVPQDETGDAPVFAPRRMRFDT